MSCKGKRPSTKPCPGQKLYVKVTGKSAHVRDDVTGGFGLVQIQFKLRARA
jgi:hypothetical protein